MRKRGLDRITQAYEFATYVDGALDYAKHVGRWFLRGLDWYVRETEETTLPIHNIEPPDGEVICPTCLGNGGWSYDWEGGWFVCPTCKGRGTVQIPPGKI